MALYSTTISSPIGDLIALADEQVLLLLEFADSRELQDKIAKIEKKYGTKNTLGKSAILSQTETELGEYFAGSRKSFTIPLRAQGTEFQEASWQGLVTIPYGETRNYQEQATSINHVKAVRAIGGANHNNPIVIIIPCHRVIGKSGKLVGYGGGLERKVWLLEHEKKHSKKILKYIQDDGY